MADNPQVTSPAGYKLDSPPAAGVQLPAGYKLDAPAGTPQPAQIQPEGSAASRFFGNLWDKTAGGAAQTAKVLYDLASHVGTPGHVIDPTGPAAQFLHDTVQAHVDQGSKAKDALSKGRYSEAAGHILAAALPVVGPAAANVGEQIGGTEEQYDRFGNVVKSGKAPDIAGGLGSATALVAPMAVGPMVSKVAGKIDAAADATAQTLVKRSLKGGYTVNAPAEDVTAAATTMRNGAILLTAEGEAKIAQSLSDVRKAIADKVDSAAKSGTTIDPDKVASRLDEMHRKYSMQVNAKQDLADINKVGNNFVEANTGPIPADKAQAMKVGSNILNADKYGKVSTAQVEAEKALTRGLKEELEAQIPELKALNAKQSELMNLDEILGKAVNKYTNSEGFIGDLGHTGIAAATLRSVLANPILKSRLAIAIDRVRSLNPGQFAASSGSGLAKLNALINALTPQESKQ